MPVPKDKQELYGKIVGHLQNIGYGLTTAKNKADSAVKTKGKGKRKAKKAKGKT